MGACWFWAEVQNPVCCEPWGFQGFFASQQSRMPMPTRQSQITFVAVGTFKVSSLSMSAAVSTASHVPHGANLHMHHVFA